MNPTFTVPTLCLHCTCTIISLNTKVFHHQLYLYLYPSQTIVQCAQVLELQGKVSVAFSILKENCNPMVRFVLEWGI